MIRVFVYGSLMRGQYNHGYFLKGQSYLGEAILSEYALYNLGSYPGIVPDNGEQVKGELYEIDQQTLEMLDRLEGNGSLYNRETVVVLKDDEMIETQVYVWNGPVSKHNKIDFQDQPWEHCKNKRCMNNER